MKKIILTAGVLAFSFSFAQKKEISAAYKAIETNDIATANAQISAADAVLGGKTYLLEPEVLEQYYYAKGLSLLKSGKTSEGAAFLAKINELGSSKIYTGKDASKNKVYFVGKSEADKSGIQGLKEETYQTTTAGKLGATLNPILQASNKEAVDAYNSKKFNVAGDKFKETYYLLKAAGVDDKSLLVNAGASYANADNVNESINVYNELINSGYTGVETTYTAKNKKTGETEKLDKNTFDLYKKMGAASDYSDFKTETSKSIEKDLYETNARNLYNAKRYDEAIKLSDAGLAKFPGDASLLNIKGLSYFNSGKSKEFIDILKKQLAQNPKDYENWYNLGVMQKNDPALESEAIQSFQKALEIKPDYESALQNLTFIMMGDDSKAIDDYNAAKKAGKMDLANKIISDRRERFMKAIPYAEKWYAVNPNNIDVVSLLKGLYVSTKNEAKAAEFKAKEAALKAQGK